MMQDNPDKVVGGKETSFRVTYFSIWERPQHLENLTLQGKNAAVYEGRDRQYKVVVTLMTEEQPESF